MLAWFILFVAFLYFEVITVNLVSIWFALGAVLALIASFITDSFLIQTLIFLLSSVLFLIVLKPFVKSIRPEKTATNADSVVGKIGFIEKDVQKDVHGIVKVNGQLWTAITNDDTILKKGTKVKVVSIEGVKLNVTEVRE